MVKTALQQQSNTAWPTEHWAHVGRIGRGRQRHAVWQSEDETLCGRPNPEVSDRSWARLHIFFGDRECRLCAREWRRIIRGPWARGAA